MKIGTKILGVGLGAFLSISLIAGVAQARGPVEAETPPAEEAIAGNVLEVVKHPDGDRILVRVDVPARTRTTTTTRASRGSRTGRGTVASPDTGEWVAIPPQAVRVGQAVSFKRGVVMENYEVKGLNKTFDKIIFSPGKE